MFMVKDGQNVRAILFCLTTITLAARTAAAEDFLRFDAASVRAVFKSGVAWNGPQMSGGPATRDPGYFVCRGCPFTRLLLVAYGIRKYQLTGPHWLQDRYVDIQAKVPPGSSRSDFRVMLRHLLAERFDCSAHWETRVVPVYLLTEDRSGRKFQESRKPVELPDTSTDGRKQRATIGFDKDGFPDLTGQPVESAMLGRRVRLRLANSTIADLISRLEAQVTLPVVDGTDLTGRYDFVLSWIATEATAAFINGGIPEPDDSLDDVGPDIFRALREQLGLQLVKSRAPIRVVVVDRMRELPSEN